MGKVKSRGSKKKSGSFSDNNNILSNLLNSLTFGIFDIHKCDANDQTWYCKFSRFFGSLLKIIVLLIIFYVGYKLIFK